MKWIKDYIKFLFIKKRSRERYVKIIKQKEDRENLEWLVFYCLSQENPIISIDKGRELLKYETMNTMRNFMNFNYDKLKTSGKLIEKIWPKM